MPNFGYGHGYIKLDGCEDLKDSKWHLVTVTWDMGNKTTLYVDNKKIAENNCSSVSTIPKDLCIGGYKFQNGVNFIGDIGETRVYTGALTSEQVNTIYEYGRQKYYSNDN